MVEVVHINPPANNLDRVKSEEEAIIHTATTVDDDTELKGYELVQLTEEQERLFTAAQNKIDAYFSEKFHRLGLGSLPEEPKIYYVQKFQKEKGMGHAQRVNNVVRLVADPEKADNLDIALTAAHEKSHAYGKRKILNYWYDEINRVVWKNSIQTGLRDGIFGAIENSFAYLDQYDTYEQLRELFPTEHLERAIYCNGTQFRNRLANYTPQHGQILPLADNLYQFAWKNDRSTGGVDYFDFTNVLIAKMLSRIIGHQTANQQTDSLSPLEMERRGRDIVDIDRFKGGEQAAQILYKVFGHEKAGKLFAFTGDINEEYNYFTLVFEKFQELGLEKDIRPAPAVVN